MTNPSPLCTELGCLRAATRRALCDKHYMQHRRAGDFGAEELPAPAPLPPETPPAPAPTAIPAPVTPPVTPPDVTAVAGMLASLLASGGTSPHVDAAIASLQEDVAILRARPAGQTFAIAVHPLAPVPPSGDSVVAHYLLPTIVEFLAADLHVMLVGPAGSGKTFLASQAAEVLGRPFFQAGAILQKYELTGYQDATGRYIPSSFYRAYTEGGLFLWDEIDASSAAALVAFNSALANGHADFPHGMAERHPAFICVGAANTFGRGADRQYVGRCQLDAATLDRYAVLECNYDWHMVQALAGLDPDVPPHEQWTRISSTESDVRAYVADIIGWEARIRELAIRHVIGPRAALQGATMLRRGMPRTIIEEALVWKGLDPAQVSKIRAGV